MLALCGVRFAFPSCAVPRGLLLGMLLAAPAVHAQETPARLPEVTVSATRVEHGSLELPAAIDSIDARIFREARAQINLSEALLRVPGVLARDRQNYAQDLQISSRGFGARASFGVRGIRLIADGIPATMPDGQGQAASFSLSSAQRIEVLRGPYASLHGNAAGGVIQVFTADGPREPTLSGGFYAGSHGMAKTGLQYGETRGPLNALVDLSRFRTGGYRAHSAARRDHFNAKLKLDAGNRGTITLIANALDQPRTQDPLGLTAEQLAENPRQAGTNAVAFNTRKGIAQTQAGLVYDLPLAGRSTLQARFYVGDRQVTQYLAIPLAAQSAPTASGGVVDLDRGYGGAGVRITREFAPRERPLTLSAGIDYDRMAERRRGHINDFGVAGELKRDQDDTVANADLYAQVLWQFAPRWTLLAGVRHSRVHFRSHDDFVTADNPDDSGAVTFVRTTPAAGVSFALSPAVSVYVNAGRGFETPTFTELAYRPGGETGLNLALRPSRSLHREFGMKALTGAAGSLSAALFRIDVEDEIVVNSSSGGRTDFRNAARTRREGIELGWQGKFARGLEAAVAWTMLEARFAQSFTSGSGPVVVPTGNRLPGVPPVQLHADLAWRHAASGFHAGIEGRHLGRIYVNDANSGSAPAHTVWSVRAGFSQRGRGWRLSALERNGEIIPRRQGLRSRACSSAPASTRTSPRHAPHGPSRQAARRSSPSRSAAPTSARTRTSRACSTRPAIEVHALPNTAGCYTPTMPCARCGSRASCSTATTWSSSRCWAIRRRCIRT
jgi:iron complex outermembrane recepter protein